MVLLFVPLSLWKPFGLNLIDIELLQCQSNLLHNKIGFMCLNWYFFPSTSFVWLYAQLLLWLQQSHPDCVGPLPAGKLSLVAFYWNVLVCRLIASLIVCITSYMLKLYDDVWHTGASGSVYWQELFNSWSSCMRSVWNWIRISLISAITQQDQAV